MKTGILRITIIPLTVAMISSCGQETSEWTEPWPDRIELLIADSIGVETGDSNYVFGAVGDVCFGAGGEILVLDQAGGHARAFSGDGEFITRIGGPGSGPGELSLPLSLACLDDGRIFILDPMYNSYEIYDGSDFSFIEQISLWGNNPPMDPWGLDANAYLGLKFEMDQTEAVLTGVSTLGRFRMGEENPEYSYNVDEFPVDLSDFGGLVKNMLCSMVFTGDRRGRVFFSVMSTDNYEVSGFLSDGTELLCISIDIHPVPRTQREMDEEKAYMESWVSRLGGIPIEWESDPFRLMITGLGVDVLDRLWVQRGTETAPVFDIFDMNGEHLLSAKFPREGHSWKFHIDHHGILAWEEDPESGTQKIYLLELPDM